MGKENKYVFTVIQSRLSAEPTTELITKFSIIIIIQTSD